MAKIYAPNKTYTGISASVVFVNGVGESDNPALLKWFQEHGYTVVKPKVASSPITPVIPATTKAESFPAKEAAEKIESTEVKKSSRKGAEHA